MSNADIGIAFGISVNGVGCFMQRNGIKRDADILKAIKIRNAKVGSDVAMGRVDFKKEKNPNWKGGISENKYRYKKIQKQRYPEKIKARQKVYVAVRSGRLKRAPCFCGETQVFAHHEDYSKPLEVIWLCRKHHRDEHENKH